MGQIFVFGPTYIIITFSLSLIEVKLRREVRSDVNQDVNVLFTFFYCIVKVKGI